MDQLEALDGYYDVVLQPFNATLMLSASANLTANGGNYSAEALSYSSSVLLINTAVVPVSNLGCSAVSHRNAIIWSLYLFKANIKQSDFPANVSGSIALISRGTCTFADKAFFAKKAGALAAVIYNNVEGILSGTLGGVNDTLSPTVGISRADGLALVAAAGNNTALVATLDIATDLSTAYSYNVIATTTYETNSTDILFLGAHSDSVAAGPGINDNGSGSAGILETAIQLAKGGYTAIPTIKFAWWTGEEEGLLGSKAYVNEYASSEELARIRLYLNFDMIASPNYVLGVYDGDSSDFPGLEPGPAGSGEAEATLVAWFKAQGYNSVPSEFTGRSDYGPFLDANIPAGGLFTGAEVAKTEKEVTLFGGTAGAPYDANYHRPGDNATNIAPEAFEINSKAIAHAVAYYGAGGFDGFPLRTSTAVTQRWISQAYGGEKKSVKSRTSRGHDGCFHVTRDIE